MRPRQIVPHVILILGSLMMAVPVIALVMTSTHTNDVIARDGLQLMPGAALWEPYLQVLRPGAAPVHGLSARAMLTNSLILALGLALVKTASSLSAAYALVYFRPRFADLWFGILLVSLFFPIETRILPTFYVASDLGLANSYAGMILPVAASGLGVLVFRQFLRQIPNELIEAARLDGAGALRFLWDFVVPLSVPAMAALFSILFVLGWNQYLWPLMINPSSTQHDTIVRGIGRIGTGSNTGLALAVLASLPPIVVMVGMQRWMLKAVTAPMR